MRCIMIPGLKTGAKNHVLVVVVEGDLSLETIVGKTRDGTVQPEATVLGVGSRSWYSCFVLLLSSVFFTRPASSLRHGNAVCCALFSKNHIIAETVLVA